MAAIEVTEKEEDSEDENETCIDQEPVDEDCS